jgi:hypothetical protein
MTETLTYGQERLRSSPLTPVLKSIWKRFGLEDALLELDEQSKEGNDHERICLSS